MYGQHSILSTQRTWTAQTCIYFDFLDCIIFCLSYISPSNNVLKSIGSPFEKLRSEICNGQMLYYNAKNIFITIQTLLLLLKIDTSKSTMEISFNINCLCCKHIKDAKNCFKNLWCQTMPKSIFQNGSRKLPEFSPHKIAGSKRTTQ